MMPGGQECEGFGRFHCCWFFGELCIYLIQKPKPPAGSNPTRKWQCLLYEENNENWQKVVRDDRYIANIEPLYQRMLDEGLSPVLMNCRDWPQGYPHLMDVPGRPGCCCYDENQIIDEEYANP